MLAVEASTAARARPAGLISSRGNPLALRVTLLGMTAFVAPMSRRKYVIAARMNEQDYPHIVELALPPGGFRSRSDAMLAFHRERGIQIRRGQGRNDDSQFYVR